MKLAFIKVFVRLGEQFDLADLLQGSWVPRQTAFQKCLQGSLRLLTLTLQKTQLLSSLLLTGPPHKVSRE